jgi:cell division transport system permease protein
VRALGAGDAAQLLEPWLGQTDALRSLPVPRLIAIELDRHTPPDLEVVRAALGKQFKGVTLDDHRRWQQQIRTITRSFALGGLAILLLVGAATTAVIVSATRSAMAANREIVEVLHFVGATDRFIAREFERHFLRLGVRAGIVGAIWAMFIFLAMPTVMELLGVAADDHGDPLNRHLLPRCHGLRAAGTSSSSSPRMLTAHRCLSNLRLTPVARAPSEK